MSHCLNKKDTFDQNGIHSKFLTECFQISLQLLTGFHKLFSTGAFENSDSRDVNASQGIAQWKE